jgi:hypothetical protein
MSWFLIGKPPYDRESYLWLLVQRMLVSGLRSGLWREVISCQLVEEGGRSGGGRGSGMHKQRVHDGARFNEIEIALILIVRARADQVVPAPVQGGLGLW